jgi:hypothetical protein
MMKGKKKTHNFTTGKVSGGKTKKKRKRRLYFGPETDIAIMEYQKTDCHNEKKELYHKTIQPSFSKLAENLIFIHGFAKNHHSYENLKSDCVSFLFETLEKFDTSRGTKAFSYFNIVAKHWLIIQSKKKVKNLTRHVSMSNFKEMKATDKESIEMYNYVMSQDDQAIGKENKEILFEMINKIKKRVNSQNEIACIHAIDTLFRKIDDLDYLNKRAVFVYLRDISGLTPKQLSVSMSNIRKYYRDIKKTNKDHYNFAIFFDD